MNKSHNETRRVTFVADLVGGQFLFPKGSVDCELITFMYSKKRDVTFSLQSSIECKTS